MKNRQVFRPVDFLYANPSVSLTLNNEGAKYQDAPLRVHFEQS